jgi:hypothetical protein
MFADRHLGHPALLAAISAVGCDDFIAVISDFEIPSGSLSDDGACFDHRLSRPARRRRLGPGYGDPAGRMFGHAEKSRRAIRDVRTRRAIGQKNPARSGDRAGRYARDRGHDSRACCSAHEIRPPGNSQEKERPKPCTKNGSARQVRGEESAAIDQLPGEAGARVTAE